MQKFIKNHHGSMAVAFATVVFFIAAIHPTVGKCYFCFVQDLVV